MGLDLNKTRKTRKTRNTSDLSDVEKKGHKLFQAIVILHVIDGRTTFFESL
jgi:hypothetical protein